MFQKYATAAILDAQMGGDAGFSKSAHRAVFDYTPRAGFLYVRSRAISSRCNDNFDQFPGEEIEKSYQTFLGKPVFVNHHNEDHRRARGVIIDAALHKDLNPDGSPDTWSELLHEVDAIKFPKLAQAILKKEVNRTSMGCDVEFSKCSVCDNVATSPLQYCAHIPGKKGKRIFRVTSSGKREGQLVFEICSGLSFFENSLLVEQPADPTAYFLGEVEMGPGLQHLSTTASVQTERPQILIQPRPMTRTASRQAPKATVWDLIKQAAEEEANVPKPSVWDLIRHASTMSEEEAWGFTAARALPPSSTAGTLGKLGPESPDKDHFLKTHGVSWEQGVQNIMAAHLNSHHAATHEKEETGEVGPAQEAHHEGMNWYKEFHKTARMITGGKAVQGKNEVEGGDPAVGAGLLAVTSPQSQLPENARKASLTFRAGHGLGGPSGMPIKPTKKDPNPPEPKPRDPHYHPGIMSTLDQAQKANRILGVKHNPETGNWDPAEKEHHSQVLGLGSPKVSNFSHTIEHGGDDPEHVQREAAAGRDGRRVTVDVHALSAYLGKRATKDDYQHVGGPPSSGDQQAGFRENHRYRQVADAYREASDRLRIHHGIHAEPHQVQAVTWVGQRNKNYEDAPGEKSSNDKAAEKWHAHVNEAHPEFKDSTHWKMAKRMLKLSYGETKAPEDVDTLRSENCTVCGNSTAFDGKQCQVCGYVAPPKAFGDPNVDTARANDLRKQVLDGDEADPMQNQQMGNQQGDPDELDEQQGDAEAGLDTAMGSLTCSNCGTGIQPAPPTSEGGEPPYPADGDVCPVCKNGQLLSGDAQEPEEENNDSNDPDADDDKDQDGIPDDEEDDDEDDEDVPPKGKKK